MQGGSQVDPTYPWEELGWQEKALEGKEKQEWSKRTNITIFGKKEEKAFWRHLTKRSKIGSKFKFKLGASKRAKLDLNESI